MAPIQDSDVNLGLANPTFSFPPPNPPPAVLTAPTLNKPSFAAALSGSKPRDRSRSISISKSSKRGHSESSEFPSYVDQAFETWSKLSASMTSVKKTIEDNFGGEDTLGPQVLKGLSLLEECLNGVANMSFQMASDFDKIKDLSLKHDTVIEKNCAGGNIVNKVEKSTLYANSCKELKESANHCKILNLDLEENISSHSDIAKKAREILSRSDNIKDRLKNMQIVPLGKSTILKNNCHSVPILLKTKSHEDKAFVEKSLKNEGYKCAYHWPKTLFKSIQQIRSQVSTFKNDEIDLTGKQIMVRPSNESGKNLNISYRDNNTSKWLFLETVKTPASDELLEKFQTKQLCTSNYFVL